MGSGISSDREQELEYENEKAMENDADIVEDNALAKKHDIGKKYNDLYNAELRRLDEEESAMMEKNLAKTKQKKNELLNMRKEMQNDLQNRKTELENGLERKIDRMKKEGKMEIDERQNDLAMGKQKLAYTQQLFDDELNQAVKILKEGEQQRGRMESAHHDQQKMTSERHQEKVLDLAEQRNQINIAKEQRLLALEEDHRKKQDNHLQQYGQLREARVNTATQLANAVGYEEDHEKFRNNCLYMITLFNKFKTIFNNEEVAMLTTMEEMEYEMELSNVPDVKVVSQSLQTITNELQQFPLSKEEDISELLKETHELTKSLKDVINKLAAKVDFYVKYIESGKADAKKTEQLMTDVNALYKLAQNSINRLSKLMLKFNIPEKNIFDEILNQRLKLMSADIGPSAITDGSSEAEEIKEVEWEPEESSN